MIVKISRALPRSVGIFIWPGKKEPRLNLKNKRNYDKVNFLETGVHKLEYQDLLSCGIRQNTKSSSGPLLSSLVYAESMFQKFFIHFNPSFNF